MMFCVLVKQNPVYYFEKLLQFLEVMRSFALLSGNRQYKYAHDRLRKMPDPNSPSEFDNNVVSEDETISP